MKYSNRFCSFAVLERKVLIILSSVFVLYEHTGYQKDMSAMANCIKLKLPGLDKSDVQLTKKQWINTTAASSTITAITSIINTTTVTANITVPKGEF